MSSYFIIPEIENHIPSTQEIRAEANKFLEEHKIREIFNHICIVSDAYLGRLIGFGYDSTDFYYRIRYFDGKETWMTCVAACESLKYVYSRYKQMENVFHINHCPREDKFVIKNLEEI